MSLSALVAGREKILIGLLAVFQTYASQLDIPEPHRGLIIALLGLGQVWLGADSVKTAVAKSAAKVATSAAKRASDVFEGISPKPPRP